MGRKRPQVTDVGRSSSNATNEQTFPTPDKGGLRPWVPSPNLSSEAGELAPCAGVQCAQWS